MTHDEIIKVINHHVKGGEIEYRPKGLSTWQAAATPNWDFSRYDFRVKPEPLLLYVEIDKLGIRYGTSSAMFVPCNGGTIKKFVEVTE